MCVAGSEDRANFLNNPQARQDNDDPGDEKIVEIHLTDVIIMVTKKDRIRSNGHKNLIVKADLAMNNQIREPTS